jgi:hypothetical protein
MPCARSPTSSAAVDPFNPYGEPPSAPWRPRLTSRRRGPTGPPWAADGTSGPVTTLYTEPQPPVAFQTIPTQATRSVRLLSLSSRAAKTTRSGPTSRSWCALALQGRGDGCGTGSAHRRAAEPSRAGPQTPSRAPSPFATLARAAPQAPPVPVTNGPFMAGPAYPTLVQLNGASSLCANPACTYFVSKGRARERGRGPGRP